MTNAGTIPLPKGWPKVVRSGVLHAIALASTALSVAWGRAASSRSSRQRQGAEAGRLRAENGLLKDELAIKDARWTRVPLRRRPYYSPIQRMQILQLKAARGWSALQTADRFLVREETIGSWMMRLDEEGEGALVQVGEPVNKFPEFVGNLVRSLKLMRPTLGKARIARILARAGLHLGATTVGRMLKRDCSRDDMAAEESALIAGRVVTAKRPNHIWHVDLTTVPIGGGFWAPWMPFSKHQRWPFAWWVAVVVDHTSRLLVGFAVFDRRPTSFEVYSFLGMAMRRSGSKPKYIIADKGKEFFCKPFKNWCRRKGIRPRYGAVGEHGSIAIIERFIRSMKSECTRRITVPFRLASMRHELGCYAIWHNEHRPHTGIDGCTPTEVYQGLPAANAMPRYEPRLRWPLNARCAGPTAPVKGKRGVRLTLALRRFENRPHLPVIELRRAA